MAACRHARCEAPPLDGTESCWGHATDAELRPALHELGQQGRLNARRVRFTRKRLEQVLDAAPRDGSGRRTLREANFDSCRFDAEVSFDRVVFAGEARFQATRFDGSAYFNDATFNAAARFEKARFYGETSFERAVFTGQARFQRTRFVEALFTDAVFAVDTSFGHAWFSQRGSFYESWFEGDLVMTEVKAGALQFTNVQFAGATSFAQAKVATASFGGCAFMSARQLGPVHVKRKLDLDNTVWHERAAIDVFGRPGVGEVSCIGARFRSGAQLRLDGTTVTLARADLSEPSIVSGFGWVADAGRPRLRSLAGADVAGLTVSGVDLGACEFVGAHHLDRLRTDDTSFATTPDGWRRTRRSVLAEEWSWRVEHSAWLRDEPAKASSGQALRPSQIAGIYRDLRKGREDNKDEPGAADFYYGEMEMRRMATRRGERQKGDRAAVGEHAILTLYWLLAGYGLRAWRSLAALGVVVVAGAVAFAAWGIATPAQSDVADGLLVSARAATAGLAGSDVELTTFGTWLQLGMRLLGPVLLGLALLSIRGRVRR